MPSEWSLQREPDCCKCPEAVQLAVEGVPTLRRLLVSRSRRKVIVSYPITGTKKEPRFRRLENHQYIRLFYPQIRSCLDKHRGILNSRGTPHLSSPEE